MPEFARRAAAASNGDGGEAFALVDPYRTLDWAEVDDILNRAANLLRDAGDAGDLGESHGGILPERGCERRSGTGA